MSKLHILTIIILFQTISSSCDPINSINLPKLKITVDGETLWSSGAKIKERIHSSDETRQVREVEIDSIKYDE